MLADMSFLLPDPAALEAIADRIDRHAAAARARAAGLSAAVAAARWHGLAADAFHAEAHLVVAALRTSAGRLETAAGTLRRHAHTVGTVLADASRLGHDGLRGLKDAVTDPGALLGDAASVLGDAGDLISDVLPGI